MPLQNITPGLVPHIANFSTNPGSATHNVDVTNSAFETIGVIATSDGGSHTIDTTGSSAIGWMAGTITFANGASTARIGLSGITGSNPVRATNSGGVITHDVYASFTGPTGPTTAAWNNTVPTNGTKTIADGDIIAFSIQMTNRGGADVLRCQVGTGLVSNMPAVVTFDGTSTYTPQARIPNVIIRFSDGATGVFRGTDLFTSQSTRTFTTTTEYGQLFQLPFKCAISGVTAYSYFSANTCDICAYLDPLGTPAGQSVTMNASDIADTGNIRLMRSDIFATPLTVPANAPFALTLKPSSGCTSGLMYKTINHADFRLPQFNGLNSYGITRTSGAFANSNSSLDHYYIWPVFRSLDDGSGGGMRVIGGG